MAEQLAVEVNVKNVTYRTAAAAHRTSSIIWFELHQISISKYLTIVNKMYFVPRFWKWSQNALKKFWRFFTCFMARHQLPIAQPFAKVGC